MPLEIMIRHIMHPIDQFSQISEKASLEKALPLMRPNMNPERPNCIVVVGEGEKNSGMITGLITPAAIVFGIAGHFLKGAEKIGPIFWEGQLKSEYMLAVKKPVAEIMQPVHTCLKHDEMLMEGIFLFNKYRVDILPVIMQEEVSGLVHIEDVLKAIERLEKATSTETDTL